MDRWGCKGKQQSKWCCLLLYPGIKDNLQTNKAKPTLKMQSTSGVQWQGLPHHKHPTRSPAERPYHKHVFYAWTHTVPKAHHSECFLLRYIKMSWKVIVQVANAEIFRFLILLITKTTYFSGNIHLCPEYCLFLSKICRLMGSRESVVSPFPLLWALPRDYCRAWELGASQLQNNKASRKRQRCESWLVTAEF